MNILLTHNFYGSSAPSGENQVFEIEKKLLKRNQHEVKEFTRHSDEIRQQGIAGIIKGAAATAWNPWMTKAITSTVSSFQPDIVHVHNTFPLISPSIFHAIGKKAARVLTLHNYRLFCPNAVPMRNGDVCTLCINQRSVIPALQHGCYRGSRLATLPLALSISLHRYLRTWVKHVDAFITLTEFQRELVIEAGLPSELVHVKPNFYPGSPIKTTWEKKENYVIFAGRLTSEKGIEALVKAWLVWGEVAPILKILGDGELKPRLEGLVSAARCKTIQFLGQLPPDEAECQIALAKLLILPSQCFEGFPMVIREAFAFGTPVAVSDIGPLPSIVKHGVQGVVFEAGNLSSLLNEVQTVWHDPEALKQMAHNSRNEYERHYNEAANYRRLIDIYKQAQLMSSRK
ncbi:glycosyltransferase family 4 protein [Leucothrix pacifica]|uniref:Glycosyltransferase family 1 protein n=1 Tax=Leucothrix pacifica TaxID=1247513 RepID=A0A317CAT4_9GAMM|nr:glycosyltransferase family 4 protein [Leucothrix pacifica]PWQ95795.1 hypothetical protein DKW60_13920 [Leucothrix pacifica]